MFRVFSFVLLVVIVLSGCFPKKAGSHLLHYTVEAPAVGQAAPDFTLTNLQGGTVSLSQLIGSKPIVLQLGSHSCPVYRYRRFGMTKLYRDYMDKVYFLLIYTQEAHPIGSPSPYADKEWLTSWNRFTSTRVHQHRSIQSRTEIAKSSHKSLKISYPMVVDDMDNNAWKSYGRAASPAYVINTEGLIVLRQPWVNPNEIRQVLNQLITASPSKQ